MTSEAPTTGPGDRDQLVVTTHAGALTYVLPERSGNGVIQVMMTIATHGGRFRGGAAAGIGASFNAPIGGRLFAIEPIIGRFRTSVLRSVVVASVVGSVTAREIIGPGIIYEPATLYSFTDARELGLYAVLGVAAALFGIAFLYGQDLGTRAFARLQVWRTLKFALGWLGVGLVALAVPEVLGTGDNLPPINGIRDPIQRMLDADVGAGFGAVACCCSCRSRSRSRRACRSAAATRSAVRTADPLRRRGRRGRRARRGRAAVGRRRAAGRVRAGRHRGGVRRGGACAHDRHRHRLRADQRPRRRTAADVAAGLATFIGDRIQPASVYGGVLAKRGIVYGEPDDVDLMQTVRVSEVVTRMPDVLTADMTLPEARREFHRTGLIRSVAWPRHTLVTGVRRAGDLIMPDGSTELQPDDRVSAIVDVDHVLDVRRLLTGSADPDVTEES